ncbi:putative reverse transcriptase domain-containing protein, partial [Tanacetum coccineum]
MARTLGAREAARNLKPLMGDGGGQKEVNGNRGNGNGGNGNGNGNGGVNGYNFRGYVPDRECTYQDFLKFHPLSFNGTEGVVGTIGIEATYAMSWAELMKLMIEVCCPRNKGYARSAESKRRLDNNPRDNRGQQPAFKRQNVGGHNVARAYTVRNNKKKGNVGSLPYYNKCKLHHAGPCTVRCGNCKRVGHITRDCTAIITPNTQRAPPGNQPGIVCYECGRPRHFRKDCPKLRNQNRGNKTGNKNVNKTGNQTRGNEATARAYAIGRGGANPESNVVTGTFLLNNCYASMLFDSGVDRSFVSSTFSALLDVAPSTLDTIHAVELANGRISEMNVVLRGCTLGLLGHSFDIDLMPVELVPGAAPVVRALYRLAAAKMQELSTQLLDAVGVIAALMDVNAAQLKLLLTVEVKTAKVRVTAAKQ